MKKLEIAILTCLTLGLVSGAPAQDRTRLDKVHAFIWDSTNGMRDLGTLGGKVSYALGINDNGVVIGYSYLKDGVTTHAFTWTAATGMRDVGKSFPGGGSTQGSAINASGNVGGNGIDSNGKQVPAFLVVPRNWRTLPENNQDQRNFCFGINNSNQLTGQLYAGEVVHGFLWDPIASSYTEIPSLPGGLHTAGTSINNLGHITGTSSLANGIFNGIFWSATGGTQDMGRAGGSAATWGEAVNDSDEVAGTGFGNVYIGFYWTQATGMLFLQNLGGASSIAFGISSTGMIAGYCDVGTAFHATLWANRNAAPQDLGTLGGTNSYARGINSAGQVVGYSEYR
jgi:probable HAF family extracellular repeat protein